MSISRLALLLATTTLLATSTRVSALPLVGLFTDYGWDDPYVAQVKGIILTIAPRTQIIDLIHSVAPFNVTEGSYLLDQASSEFPSGTIIVAVVDPQFGSERDPILIQTGKGKYYLGRDNGLFTAVVLREGFGAAWKLDKPEVYRDGSVSRTFHGRDIFGPVAAHLAAGSDPGKLGTPIKTISLLPGRDPSQTGGTISAVVEHIDHFGNVILNIHQGGDASGSLKEGNLVKIQVGRESYGAPLVKTYSEAGKGRPLLLYNSSGQLEISVNQGSAARMLKVEPGQSVFLKP